MTPRKHSLFEVRHPFFLPFWRRALVTALCLGWAGFEFWNGAPAWASVFAVCGVYLFIQFFIRFDPAEYQPEDRDAG